MVQTINIFLTLFILLLVSSTKLWTSASFEMKVPSKYGSSDLNRIRKIMKFSVRHYLFNWFYKMLTTNPLDCRKRYCFLLPSCWAYMLGR